METVNYVEVGKRIKLLRTNAGISQKALAIDFHLPHNGVISMYETGRRYLPLDVLVKYSNKFNVSTDWILKGCEICGDTGVIDNTGGIEELKGLFLKIKRPDVRQVALRQLRALASIT